MNVVWAIVVALALASNACAHAASPLALVKSPGHRRLLQREENIMPTLSDGYGPWSPHFTNSIALCAVIRDENATDIREWLQYYKWLGMDHVYLTENFSKHPIKDALTDYIESGFLTYETEDQPHAQMIVYQRCLEKYREMYNWMAFFDADEYLALREKNTTLKQFLDQYKHFPGLAVHWVIMGANGHETRPERGGTLRHYTQCQPEAHTHIKIIANTFFVRAHAGNPHTMYFRGHAAPVNEGRHPIAYFPYPRECTTQACHAHPGHSQIHPELRSVDRIALFHYITKSRQDMKIKVERGNGSSDTRKPMEYFEEMQRGQTDEPICKELARVADACCPETWSTSGTSGSSGTFESSGASETSEMSAAPATPATPAPPAAPATPATPGASATQEE